SDRYAGGPWHRDRHGPHGGRPVHRARGPGPRRPPPARPRAAERASGAGGARRPRTHHAQPERPAGPQRGAAAGPAGGGGRGAGGRPPKAAPGPGAPPRPAAPPGPPTRLRVPAVLFPLAASAVAWAVVFAAVPPEAQEFPLGDDWAFSRGAFLFARGQ